MEIKPVYLEVLLPNYVDNFKLEPNDVLYSIEDTNKSNVTVKQILDDNSILVTINKPSKDTYKDLNCNINTKVSNKEHTISFDISKSDYITSFYIITKDEFRDYYIELECVRVSDLPKPYCKQLSLPLNNI